MAQELQIIQSLFGPSPQEAAMSDFDQRQAESFKRNAQIAQATPWQQVGMLGGMAGEQVGEGLANVGGLLAGVDTSPPNVRKARIVQGVLSQLRTQGVDFNDPNVFVPAITDALAKNGMAGEAANLAMQYQPQRLAQMKAQAELMGKQAEALRKLRGIGDVSPKDFTPASLRKFQETGNYADLQAAEGSVAAPVLAQRQWTETLDRMRANGTTFDQLDPFEQARVYGLAAQVVGAEAAKSMFPSFTNNGSLTVEEAKSVRFATMMARAEPTILQLESQGFRFSNQLLQLLAAPNLDKEAAVIDVLKRLPVPDEEMRAMDAYLNYLGPALYQKTGAAVTISEFLRDMRGSVPWSWDNEASIREKQLARRAQLVGSEEGFTAPGLGAYNRARERFGLPPAERVIRGPLDSPAPNKSARPETGTRPVSRQPFPDRNNPAAVREWLRSASTEDKKAYLESL